MQWPLLYHALRRVDLAFRHRFLCHSYFPVSRKLRISKIYRAEFKEGSSDRSAISPRIDMQHSPLPKLNTRAEYKFSCKACLHICPGTEAKKTLISLGGDIRHRGRSLDEGRSHYGLRQLLRDDL
jgi:hypothetical protein